MNAVGGPRISNRLKTESTGGAGSSSGSSSRNDVTLSFYSEPPHYEMSLDEFEEFALARLKVLRKIEELKTRNITGDNFRKALDKTISENISHTTDPTAGHDLKPNSRAARLARQRVDHASHFILRAAYCKTEDLRRWFLSQETFLFKHQLEKIADGSSSSSSLGLQTFLKENNLHFNPVPDAEKKKITPQLLCIMTPDKKIPSLSEIAHMTYFKIPFQEATDLLATRQCYLHAGYAYVPMRRIVTIVVSKFRMALSKSLAQASRVFASVTADYTPIAPLLNSMNSQYVGKEYTSTNNMEGEYELTSQNIEEYSSSMPLCMRTLHMGLKDDHKLKHHGRLQYGLFLKGAGMSMEESLIFFQREFTKVMTSEKFQKEYTYNIRHMYGKEGKRTSYTPYSCTKIIMGTPPNSGDHHGCPYRHYDDGHLSSVLSKLQIGTAAERNQILHLKKSKHYNLACMKHFEVMHPHAAGVEGIQLQGVGEHPNAWFASSVAYRKAKSGSAAGGGGGGGGSGEKKGDGSPVTPNGKSNAMKLITPQK